MLKYHRDVPANHPKREMFMQIYRQREELWDRLLGATEQQLSEWTKQDIESVIKAVQEYIFFDYFDARQELSAKDLRKMIQQLCQISLSLLRGDTDTEYITGKLQVTLQQITQHYTE